MASLPISVGDLFELIRPATYALAALASAGILTDARRREFHPYVVYALTLLALLLPLVALPLYLAARLYTPRRAETETTRRLSWRLVPLLYLLALALAGGVYLYRDYTSVEGYLARAASARLAGRHERAADAYRAALRLEETAHTRKLLAIELSASQRHEEALAELLLAERGGETDSQIPYLIGRTLDALNRHAEAARSFQKFLESDACTQASASSRCAEARARVESLSPK